MGQTVSDDDLDAILAAQVFVAWAGEKDRLNWWATDLLHEDAGGDFFKRLLPRTHQWAALEAVREAARRTDHKARSNIDVTAQSDTIRTLYFFGFELDEQVEDRWQLLKRRGDDPTRALPLLKAVAANTAKPQLIELLTATLCQRHGGPVKFSKQPGGRKLAFIPNELPVAALGRFTSALIPLIEHYPLPYVRVDA